MRVVETELPGVLVVEHQVHRDDRGFFCETFHAERFALSGLAWTFRQDNHTRSVRNVLRGLHYQLRQPQGKLVTCVSGEIFDVAVDIRRGSPTFGRWTGVLLHGDAPRSLWIPPGFAHGLCVLSATADVVYKCTELYDADDDRGVLWCDPTIDVQWPIADPLLSPKDARMAPLSPTRDDLPVFVG